MLKREGDAMVSEEIILDRETVTRLVAALQKILDVESHYQIKLRFVDSDRGSSIVIVPHALAVEIPLT